MERVVKLWSVPDVEQIRAGKAGCLY